ncbi:MAG TPA: M20/M25/M40 family metallo-hydrolase [Longimicrobium sp.]|nr:M20/M25/M40 family metallo-hydrolase [Longimicrobium sp.]
MRKAILMSAVAAGLAGTAAAQPGPRAARPVDWDALRAEAVQVLSDYLRVNTANPPGNELAGARFLQGILQREGIEARILDEDVLGPGRANLYARLEGDGSKKAIALVHHIDVVPATAGAWTVPPFSGEVRDGYIWGRGAIDMKGDGIAHLMAMIALKRSGVPLTRDIVYIANADEELGSTGAAAFVDRHADLLADVEFLITEGGDIAIEDGELQFYGVGVAEKRTLWQRLSIKGTPSHASRPTRQNPVPRLVAALNRLAQYETALEVTPGVEKYFRDISRNYEGEQRAWLADVRTALNDARAREWILSDVYWNAILRNTISLTVLNGSNKTNVIPAEATAELDIRLLPTADPDQVLATLKRIAADDAITWTTLMAPKTPLENPVDTDLFRAIERAARERDPGALVTTPMFTAASDRPTYRRLGIVTYGLDPFKVENAEHQKMMHGNDERLSVENLGWGTRFLYDILRYAQ